MTTTAIAQPAHARTLRTIPTHCLSCRQQTPERIVADAWVRHLRENQRFGGLLRIVQCQTCGLMYLNPRPAPEDLPRVYDFDVYADSTNSNPVLMAHFHDQLVRHRPTARRVLEVGCGTGQFLYYLAGKYLECEGIEYADTKGRRIFRGPIRDGGIEELELPEERYDAIFVLNTMEHLADPLLALRKMHRALTPGGVLLLRHPNAGMYLSPGYRYSIELGKLLLHSGLRLAGQNPSFGVIGFKNQHLFYFTERTITRLLGLAGFTVQSVSTVDPYNRLRMQRAWKAGNVVEGSIAGLRHLLGRWGLGPELLTVARR
jgi:SAM-dependent methyltransferase